MGVPSAKAQDYRVRAISVTSSVNGVQSVSGAELVNIPGVGNVPGYLNTASNVAAGVQANGLPTMNTTDVGTGDFLGNGIPGVVALSNDTVGSGATAPNRARFTIFHGVDDGTFSAPNVYEILLTSGTALKFTNPSSLTVTDFNLSGQSGLAIGMSGTDVNGVTYNDVLLLSGSALTSAVTGSFVPTINIPLPAPPVSVVAGTLDAGPYPSLAVATRSNPGRVQVFLANGSALTGSSIGMDVTGITGAIGLDPLGNSIAASQSLTLGRSNFFGSQASFANKYSDVFIATSNGINVAGNQQLTNNGISIINRGGGVLGAGNSYRGVRYLDLNGDGIPDVTGLNLGTSGFSTFFGSSSQNDYNLPLTSLLGASLQAFEYDGLGRIRGALDDGAAPGNGSVTLSNNNGQGTFTTAVVLSPASGQPTFNPSSIKLTAGFDLTKAGQTGIVLGDGATATSPGGIITYAYDALGRNVSARNIPSPAPTSLTVASTSNPVTFLNEVDMFVTLLGGPVNPIIALMFDNGNPFATVSLDSKGVGTAQVSFSTLGVHTITAVVPGTPTQGGIVSSPLQQVVTAPTAFANLVPSVLTTPAGPFTDGDPVQITVSITNSAQSTAPAINAQGVTFLTQNFAPTLISAGSFNSCSRSFTIVSCVTSTLAPGATATATIAGTVSTPRPNILIDSQWPVPGNGGINMMFSPVSSAFAPGISSAVGSSALNGKPSAFVQDDVYLLDSAHNTLVSTTDVLSPGPSIQFLSLNTLLSANMLPTAATTFKSALNGANNIAITGVGNVFNSGVGTLLVGRNDGTGSMLHDITMYNSFPATAGASFAIAVNFGGHSYDDVAFIDATVNGAYTVLNDGTDSFLTPRFAETGAFGPTGAAVGDLAGNGVQGMIVTNEFGFDTGLNLSPDQNVSVMAGQGNGTLAPPTSLLSVPHHALAVAGGEINTTIDGQLVHHVVSFTNSGLPSFVVLSVPSPGATPEAIVLIDDPAHPGTFIPQPPIFLPQLIPALGNPGPYTLQTMVLPPTAWSNFMAMDNFAVGNGAGTVVYLLNNGTNPPTFTPMVRNAGGTVGPLNLLPGDFDANGLTDMAMNGYGGNENIIVQAASSTISLNPGFNLVKASMPVRVKAPTFLLAFPTSATPGSQVLILGTDTAYANVFFNNMPAVVLERTSIELTAVVPRGVGTSNMTDSLTMTNPTGSATTAFAISPLLEAASKSINFNGVASGQSAIRTVTLANTGGSTITYSAPVLQSGAASGFFINTPPPTLMLGPSQTTSFTVGFNPLSLGPATGDVLVTSNAGNIDFALQGIGISSICPAITVVGGDAQNPATIGLSAAPSGIFESGGTGPYTIMVTGLPPGLQFNGSDIGGTPTQIGNFNVSIVVTDANGCTGTKNFVFVVTGHVTNMGMLASSNPAVFGQLVTLSATESTPTPGISGLPTGTVTFMEGATPLGTSTLDKFGTAVFNLPLSTSVGSHIIVGNYGGDSSYMSATASFTEVFNQDATTSSVMSSLNPAPFGQMISLTATESAAAPGSGMPTGVVTFTEGVTPLGTSTLDKFGNAVLTLPTTTPVGTHLITVNYAGNVSFQGNTITFSQVVNFAPTTTTVKTSLSPSTFGQPVDITVTVTPSAPSSGVPSGPVDFFANGVFLGSATLSNSGTATLTVSTLTVGSDAIGVNYAGDSNYNHSTGTATQIVNKGDTTTTVSITPGTSAVGQPVTFTATVTPVPPASAMPLGTVTFSEGGVVLATVQIPLGSNTVTAPFAYLGPGSHTLTAQYSGDAHLNGSTGSATQSVSQDSTQLTFTPSIPSAVFGQPFTVSGLVSDLSPGSSPLAGPITIQLGGVTYATTTNSAGQFVYGPISATITASILVQYSGNSTNQASSLTLPFTVSPANTVATLMFASNPGTFGQLNTATFNVAAMAPGSGVPGGMVNLLFNGIVSASATLSPTGMAVFPLTTTPAGNYTVEADYLGNSNYLGTRITTSFQQARSATATIEISSANPSNPGQSVQFNAMVSEANAGTNVPTGTGQFLIDGSNFGPPVTLVKGAALSFLTSTLLPGVHVVTLNYLGDANNGPSTATLTQNVGEPNVAVKILSHSAGAPGREILNLQFTNNGLADALGVSVNFAPRALAGGGTLKLDPSVAQPLLLGNLKPGAQTTVQVLLDETGTVTRGAINVQQLYKDYLNRPVQSSGAFAWLLP